MAKVEERIETYEYACLKCGEPVKTFWAFNTTKMNMCLGLKSDPSYVLVADWIYHTKCWDQEIKEHPP